MGESYERLAGIQEQQIPGPDRSPEAIDVAAILKASQAISGEMITDKLVERLMRIVVVDAGAERALLLCPEDNNWRADAVGNVDGSSISVDICATVGELHKWSDGAVNIVSQTGEHFSAQ